MTKIKILKSEITRIKTPEKDGYSALIIKAGKNLKEIKVEANELAGFKVGDEIKLSQVLHHGDKVIVRGISKGKGFAGVVKRWGFAGGPKTHGQSDRERAPGSIGMRTTPGRVFKGKKMAGRMGGRQLAVKGLVVMGVEEEKGELLVKGLVPGAKKGFLTVTKIGEAKKSQPLLEEGEREIRALGLIKETHLKESKDEKAKEETKPTEGDKNVNA